MAIDLRGPSAVAREETNGNGAATEHRGERRRLAPKRGGGLRLIGGLAAAALVTVAAVIVYRSFAGESAPADLLTHTMSRGDLVVSVAEEGALESAKNDEIKCLIKGGGTIVWVVDSGATVEPGDLLVQFDTSVIDERVSQQQIAFENAEATLVQSESDLAVAKIALTEYEEGTYPSALKTAESNVALAQSHVYSAENILEHSQRMFRKGFQSQLDVDTNAISLKQAELQLEIYEAELNALQQFTRAKMVQELQAAVAAAEARVRSDRATRDLEQARLEREKLQLQNCEIRAKVGGMVLYAKGREWEETPTIDVGQAVPEQKTLLKIPDLNNMQVKINVHESKIDRVKPGMPARIKLLGTSMTGEVATVATVTSPAGWWNGNEVAYDTTIKLDAGNRDLKPGMSVEVEVFLAEYHDVLKLPVAAVVEQNQKFHCWIQNGTKIERRDLILGDSNDQYIVVEQGLDEGDVVVLNPDRFIEDERSEALRPVDESPGASQPSGGADSDRNT